MAKWQCNSCQAIYEDVQRDGSPYAHACPPEVIEHAKFDDEGKLLTPEKRTPRTNRRDENAPRNLQYHSGKPVLVASDPHDATRQVITPADSLIVSEGYGRTLLEA